MVFASLSPLTFLQICGTHLGYSFKTDSVAQHPDVSLGWSPRIYLCQAPPGDPNTGDLGCSLRKF